MGRIAPAGTDLRQAYSIVGEHRRPPGAASASRGVGRGNLPRGLRLRHGVFMSAKPPLVTMLLGNREIAVRRVALSPTELEPVLGERRGDILARLKTGDLDSVRGSARWLVRVESAVAFAEAKVRAGLLGHEALDRLAALIEGSPARPRRPSSPSAVSAAMPSSSMNGKWQPQTSSAAARRR
jgi:hypothetical protein